jgi:hypothetical protein
MSLSFSESVLDPVVIPALAELLVVLKELLQAPTQAGVKVVMDQIPAVRLLESLLALRPDRDQLKPGKLE